MLVFVLKLRLSSVDLNNVSNRTSSYLSRVTKVEAGNPQKLTQLSPRSHPRHPVGKRTAQKDTITDTTSDSQVNSNFPH